MFTKVIPRLLPLDILGFGYKRRLGCDTYRGFLCHSKSLMLRNDGIKI